LLGSGALRKEFFKNLCDTPGGGTAALGGAAYGTFVVRESREGTQVNKGGRGLQRVGKRKKE